MTGPTRAQRLRRARELGREAVDDAVAFVHENTSSPFDPHVRYLDRRSSMFAYLTGALRSAADGGSDAELGAYTRGLLEGLEANKGRLRELPAEVDPL